MTTRKRISGWIVTGYAQWVTDGAALIDIPDHGQEWIPLSQIRDVVSGTLDPGMVNRRQHDGMGRAKEHHNCPVELAVNPWFVELKKLPYDKPNYPAQPGSRTPRSATISRPPV
jgi:hypothetical protein